VTPRPRATIFRSFSRATIFHFITPPLLRTTSESFKISQRPRLLTAPHDSSPMNKTASVCTAPTPNIPTVFSYCFDTDIRYADEPSLQHLSSTVPYLFQTGSTATPVAQLDWRPLQMMEEQTICGLTVVPFTMSHHRSFDNSTCIGSDCSGFVFNHGVAPCLSLNAS
jgi:hypothetical protein